MTHPNKGTIVVRARDDVTSLSCQRTNRRFGDATCDSILGSLLVRTNVITV